MPADKHIKTFFDGFFYNVYHFFLYITGTSFLLYIYYFFFYILWLRIYLSWSLPCVEWSKQRGSASVKMRWKQYFQFKTSPTRFIFHSSNQVFFCLLHINLKLTEIKKITFWIILNKNGVRKQTNRCIKIFDNLFSSPNCIFFHFSFLLRFDFNSFFDHISAVGPPNRLSWTTNPWSQLPHNFWISSERQMTIRLKDQLLSWRNNTSSEYGTSDRPLGYTILT